MPDFLEMMLRGFAFSATVWLGLGLWLSHTLKQTPAKAHGILVASWIGTLVTPLFFWLVSQVNWGMLPAQVEGPKPKSISPEAVEQGKPIAIPVMASNPEQGMSLGNRPEPFSPPENFGGVGSGSTNTFPPVSTAPLFWKHWVLVVWLGLTGILFLRLLLDFVLGYRLFRSSHLIQSQEVSQELEILSRKIGNRVVPKLATSKEVSSPVLWAWSRPARILIPQGVDGKEIPEGVYLHELAHFTRKDHVWAFLGELVLCLLPWHPLSWITRRQLSNRAEEACDDWVIACGCQPLDYADELVKLAPCKVGALTMAAVSKPSRLKERVRRLIEGVFSSPRLGRRWIVEVSSSGVLLAFGLATIQPQSLKAEILSLTGEGEEPNQGRPSKNQLAQDKPEPGNGPDQKKQILTTVNGTFAQPVQKPGGSLNSPATSPLKKEVEIRIILEEKPVAGATVWVETESTEKGGKTTTIKIPEKLTSTDGIVLFTLPVQINAYHVYAKAKPEYVTLGSFFVRDDGDLIGENRMTLLLYKTGTASGILYFENKPFANAECKIKLCWNHGVEVENKSLGQIGTPYSKEFPEATKILKTGPDGKFTFQGILDNQKSLLEISQPGLGKGGLPISTDKPIEATVVPKAEIALSIEGEKHPVTIKKLEWKQLGPSEKSPDSKPFIVPLYSDKHLFSYAATEIPGVYTDRPGKYSLSIPVDSDVPFHFGPSQEVVLESGKTINLVLKKHPFSYCKGRILDAKTGKGIPDFPVQLKGTKNWIKYEKNSEFEYHKQKFTETILCKTDSAGKFSIPCKGGYIYTIDFGDSIYGKENKTDYEFPYWNLELQKRIPLIPHFQVGEKETVEFPDIHLTPSRTITGLVRDDSGKPVDGSYQVYCLGRETFQPKPPQIEKGKFTISQLRPDVPLKVFIRKGNAVNYPYLNLLEKLDAPIEFAISAKNQVSCKGKIVDENGKPIPKAQVSLIWEMDDYSNFSRGNPLGWWAKELELRQTDEQGNFDVHGLWPGELYYIRVKARGFENWQPPKEGVKKIGKTAECEETIDFGTTVLKKKGTGQGK